MNGQNHRFTTKFKTLDVDGTVNWGGSTDWSEQIDSQEGIAVASEKVTPVKQISDGLVARWTFSDGTAIDEVSGLEGTLHGVSHLPSGGPSSDGALEFDGDNDWVEFGYEPAIDFAGPNSLTVSVWSYFDGMQAQYTPLLFMRDENDSTAQWGLGCDSQGDTMLFLVKDASGSNTVAKDTETLPTNQWVHFAGVADHGAGEIRFYRDGIERASAAASFDINDSGAAANMGFTEELGSGRFLDGRLAQVSVFDRALSSTEIEQVYSNG